jgi:hypothetical protein
VKSRTVKQNSALHVYAGLLAEALDDAGHDMRTLIQVPIKPTMDNVKETIIKPVMTALYPGITSTTQLTTKRRFKKMKPETMMIDDVKYIREDAVKQPIKIGEKRIIVADRGWVFVGDCIDNDDGSVTIHNAYNIRNWGTTKGLGELSNGPTSKTTKDFYGTVKTFAIVTIAVTGGW